MATTQVVSTIPTSCPSQSLNASGVCTANTLSENALSIFLFPASILGMTNEGFGVGPILVSGGVWLVGLWMLSKMFGGR